ncbi:apolipoprotein N-acyltransferase [Algihabitans albus]|uniref:apolipoprotein N-acyltransferase n=1 Tax=Algihabitans albus TaxID=2164067 RepID=UPI000E5C9D31|nr:apolipoprotein N-acyltransferase [Algihabitans albus]
MLSALAARLSHLKGRRRLALGVLLGVVAAGALPPLYLVPLLIPAFVGLVWLMDGATTRSAAFGLGWAFGAGYFLAGLYWVGIAMTVDFAAFWWFLPIAVGGLSVGLAIFTGGATLAAWSLGWHGPGRIFLLTAAWLTAEWLRSWVLTGFPWNLVGSVWSFSDIMLQPAALGGVWLLSVLTLLAATAPATLIDRGVGLRRWGVTIAAYGLLLLAAAGGSLRLGFAPPTGEPAVPDLRLRIVQPNIAQETKWQRELRLQHLRDQATLSMSPGWEEITHVIWPETAVPFLLDRDSDLLDELGQLARPGTVFLFGAPLRNSEADDSRGPDTLVYNSVLALQQNGEIAARYDKFHLVPFGEYVPFRGLFGMDKITGGRRDFTPGPGLRTLEIPGLPAVGPLVCYEVIFSGRVVADIRPNWLLNLTNDAWFGTSSGPHQHFATARLRAVEEGLPLVRAANTGISAVIDPYGRTVVRLGLNSKGVIDAALPEPLTETPYASLGRWFLLPIILLLLIAGLLLGRPKKAPPAD